MTSAASATNGVSRALGALISGQDFRFLGRSGDARIFQSIDGSILYVEVEGTLKGMLFGERYTSVES
jgi:hypothetical protein